MMGMERVKEGERKDQQREERERIEREGTSRKRAWDRRSVLEDC